MQTSSKILVALFCLVVGSQALANPCPPGNPPTNCAPPTGGILDLNGTAIPHSAFTLYTTPFVATSTVTNLSFTFRDDPTFILLDDVVVTQGGGPNLVVNGGFESGLVGGAPVGWTFLNAFGATYGGMVLANGSNIQGTGAISSVHSGANSYVDGAVQAYDGITQAIATTPGATYSLSFYLLEDGSLPTFSRLSTNGNTTDYNGNGVDLVVFAGAIPTLVPEPDPLGLLAIGAIAFATAKRRRAP